MSILINILSTFNSKGLTDAEKRTKAFNQTLKVLGGTMLATFGTRRIVQFSKASVRAFAEDNKSAAALTKTLENLNLAFESTNISDFIDSTQMAAAVSDEVLRPAMQDLLRATQSAAEAQQLLNLALDISAGTGKNLRSVTMALSRAYLGNNTSLSRLNAGLSKSVLATASFEEITSRLSDLFSGDAQRAANTYRGRLDRLQIAADEARETIGEGLVTAIEILGQGQGIEKAQKKMEGFATTVSNLAIGLAVIGRNANVETGGFFGKLGELIGDLTRFNQLNKDLAIIVGRELGAQAGIQAQSLSHVKELSKLSTNVRKQEEKTTKTLKESDKLRKDQAKLAKAQSMMDLEKIQIEAALQGDITENERLRLQLMKAILNENADKATTIADKLSKSQTDLATLKAAAYDFKPESPFDAWLVAIEAMRTGLASMGANIGVIPGSTTTPGNTASLSTVPVFPEIMAPGGMGFLDPNIMNRQMGVQPLNINITANDFLSQEAKQAVVDAVVEASGAGIATNWFRTTGTAIPIA